MGSPTNSSLKGVSIKNSAMRSEGAAAGAAQAATAPPSPGVIPRPSEVRVLVVDDDDFTLEATTMILRKCGYDAVGCSSGDEQVFPDVLSVGPVSALLGFAALDFCHAAHQWSGWFRWRSHRAAAQ